MLATIKNIIHNPKRTYCGETSNQDRPLYSQRPVYSGEMSFKDYLQSDLYRQKQRLLDEKIKKLIDYGYDQEVKRRTSPIEIGSGTWDYSHVDDEFKIGRITSEALEKGNGVSKRVKEIADVPLEIYLFSLDNPSSNDGSIPTARDLYIAKKQEVTPASCDISAYDVISSKLDIRDNLKKRIVGWSHSHGDLNPSFSPKDKKNIARMLEESTLKKRIRILDPMIKGEGYKGVEYEVRYTSAIVFNALNAKPFVAVAVEYTRRYDGKKVFYINEHCQLRVIEESNGIDIDPASIDRQLLERVYYNGRRLGEIAGRRYVSPQVVETTKALTQKRETPETQLATRVKTLEDICNQFQKRIEWLERRDKRFKKMYGLLRNRYRALQREYKPKKSFLPRFLIRSKLQKG